MKIPHGMDLPDGQRGSTKPLEMFLCESERLVLRADQPYIFRVDPDCEKCVEIHAVYAEPTDG